MPSLLHELFCNESRPNAVHEEEAQPLALEHLRLRRLLHRVAKQPRPLLELCDTLLLRPGFVAGVSRCAAACASAALATFSADRALPFIQGRRVGSDGPRSSSRLNGFLSGRLEIPKTSRLLKKTSRP